MLVDEIITAAQGVADLRNGEVVDRILERFGREKCRFCQCKDDYVYCKIQAKKMRVYARVCRVGDGYVGIASHPFANNSTEMMKMAKEFRAAMYKEGRCTCGHFLILSPERLVHG